MAIGHRSLTSTLSADLTLTDSGETLHYIDGGALDRDVNLPTASARNPTFVLINTGLTILTILQGTTVVGFLLPDKGATIYSNGTTWIATGEGQSKVQAGQVYAWGGNSAAGNFLHICNEPSNTGADQGVADNRGAFHVAVEAGTIDAVSFTMGGAGDHRLKLYINEVVVSENIEIGHDGTDSHGEYRFAAPISVSVGDRLAIETDTAPGAITVSVMVRNTPTVGYSMGFAGDVNADLAYYQCSQTASNLTSQATPDYESSYIVIGDGNIVRVVWVSESAGGADGTPVAATQVVAAGGRTLTFTSGGLQEITASSGSFITDGYKQGYQLTVAGTASNDGVYNIIAVTALVLGLEQAVTAEGPISATATLDAEAVVIISASGVGLVHVPLSNIAQTGGTNDSFFAVETTSIAFSAGDIISVRAAWADFGDATITLYTDVIGEAFHLGGNPADNNGLVVWSNGNANNVAITSVVTQARCNRAGRVSLTHRSSGSVTGPFQLLKNGIVSESLAISGTSSSNITTNTIVARGDILSIKTDGTGAEIVVLLVVK